MELNVECFENHKHDLFRKKKKEQLKGQDEEKEKTV